MNATWDPVADLTSAEHGALLALLERHFSGVTPAQFAADLAEKTQIVRLWDGDRLVGFSSFAYGRTMIAGAEIGAVWSGDTIVDPVAWNAALLPTAWLAAVRACHGGRGRLAWCLICSGVRTWRLMPVFYRRSAPLTEPTPDLGDDPADDSAALAALRDHLAHLRYGAGFDPASGVVRLSQPQVLRPHLCPLPDHLVSDPLVLEFLRRNPGHQHGDELACATWVEPANLTAAGARIWRLADRLLEDAQ